ncbi:MAG: response regulator [Lentisphaerales bacterium]|nr:response regulator [Lentisphaerales bacterium]
MYTAKIHIVDEAKSYSRLQELLQNDPFLTTVSHDSSSALDDIRGVQPDLVIIDIHISDNKGIKLCQTMQTINEFKNIIVVFMTVSGFPYLIGQAYKAGAKDFITKPFSPFETVLRIRSLVDLVLAKKEASLALKKEHDALIKANDASKVKSQFLAVMSHEIRTPLNAVIGFSDLLSSERLNSEQLDMVRAIKGASDTLLNLVNDILDLTKIEAGKIELEHEQFLLENIVFESAELARTKLKTDNVEINIVFNAQTNFVCGDEMKLRQILINLISNAVKFTESGEICVSVFQKGTDFYFKVTDTGIGMTQEQCDIIFEPFRQADSSTTRKYGGTGLGLSICCSFIAAMGGILEVTSKVDIGSCFSFNIEMPIQNKNEFQPPQKSYNGSILIVDANPNFRENFALKLRSMGFYTESHERIADLITDKYFDYVFINPFNYSDISKFLIESLKVICSTKKIFALTNRIDTHLKKHLNSKGFKRFLCKPIRESALESIFDSSPNNRKSITKNFDVEFQNLNLLIVEDNILNQKLIYKLLTGQGHSIITAENGLEAIRILERKSFDLIFMDMQMPELDGCAATKIIRRELKVETPIIAMTANAFTQSRRECKDAGMNDFIPKPINEKRLFNILSKYTVKSKPHDCNEEYISG